MFLPKIRHSLPSPNETRDCPDQFSPKTGSVPLPGAALGGHSVNSRRRENKKRELL